MRKNIPILTLVSTITACSATSDVPMLGSQHDSDDCISSAGYSYSILKQRCVQPFAIAEIKLPDPNNNTLAVYVILSEDRQQAEVFATDLAPNILLDVVKGGYVSKDGKVRLLKYGQDWQLRK